jgi:hypothetical protein
MPATNYTINKILNWNFGRVAYNPDDNGGTKKIWLGLSDMVLDATIVAGATIGTHEPATANGYVRYGFTNDQTNHWSNSTLQTLQNGSSGIVTFGPATTSGWGTMLALFMSDAETRATGNILWYMNLNPTIISQLGTTITFAAGSIVVTM